MNKEEFDREKNFIEQSTDLIAQEIKEKIKVANLEKWQIGPIVELIKKERITEAVGRLGEEIVLNHKEKRHFSDVPVEIILKWFKESETEKNEK